MSSFQRKNQVIGRTPVNRGSSGPGIQRAPVPGRPLPSITPSPLLGQRRPLVNTGRNAPGNSHIALQQQQQTQPEVQEKARNPAVKPSIVTSEPTISTGCSDLDKLLLHGGIPLGSSLILEETGSTDYSLVLLKYFATQGILHNRINDEQNKQRNKNNCHVIVIGANPNLWLKELPGVYKGSRKEVKKQQIIKNESKLSVQNIINNPPASAGSDRHSNPNNNNNNNPEEDRGKSNNLKIAWRYGLKDSKDSKNADLGNVNYPYYNNTFDITSRLIPAPSSQEITFLQLGQQLTVPPSLQQREPVNLLNIYKQLESMVKNQTNNGTNNKVIRIVIPNLLNPSNYSPEIFQPSQILPFLQLLKSAVAKYPKNVTLISSISLNLFSPDLDLDTSVPSNKSSLVCMVEKMFDSVFQLVPFNQNLIKLLEISYKNQPNKIQQGFVNVLKITNVSDRGSMVIKMNEYAFRNGKRNFEITEWSIPVDNEEVDDKTKEVHDVKPEQTAKDIEF